MARHVPSVVLAGLLSCSFGGCRDNVLAQQPERATRASQIAALQLSAGRIMLQPRANLDRILGQPKREEVADCESSDRGFAYPDDSYVCTRNGRVTFLSYVLKQPVKTTSDALQSVGLLETRPPISLISGIADIWLYKRGNPLTVDGKTIPRVIVFLRSNTVVIDMTGWEKIQSEPVPNRSSAMIKEWVDLLKSDFPSIIRSGERAGRQVTLYVAISWRALPADRRRFITQAAHTRWAAVGRLSFNENTDQDVVLVKDERSKVELAKWAPVIGVVLNSR